MHLPLLLAGKRAGLVLSVTSTSGLPPSHLFFITGRISHLCFLVDTGAEVSVIPPSCCGSTYPSTGPSLQAANQSPIATHGVRPLCLILGLCRRFQWTFIVADVKHPILGRLPPERLKIAHHACQELDRMLALGIIHPSSSC